jgi:hypothetical protein
MPNMRFFEQSYERALGLDLESVNIDRSGIVLDLTIGNTGCMILDCLNS